MSISSLKKKKKKQTKIKSFTFVKEKLLSKRIPKTNSWSNLYPGFKADFIKDACSAQHLDVENITRKLLTETYLHEGKSKKGAYHDDLPNDQLRLSPLHLHWPVQLLHDELLAQQLHKPGYPRRQFHLQMPYKWKDE